MALLPNEGPHFANAAGSRVVDHVHQLAHELLHRGDDRPISKSPSATFRPAPSPFLRLALLRRLVKP
jgi:hypothetical protein